MTRGDGEYLEPDRAARLFVAIRFPADLKTRIECATEPLRRLERVRWGSIEQLHLTLRFLGQTRGDRIDEIAGALREALARVPSFLMDLDGGGAFPSSARARVVWLGVRGTPELRRLHRAVELALAAVGISADHRPFRPHVTLGRVRRGPPPIGLARAIEELHLQASLTVRAVSLMESRLAPTGSRYTEIGSCPLALERPLRR